MADIGYLRPTRLPAGAAALGKWESNAGAAIGTLYQYDRPMILKEAAIAALRRQFGGSYGKFPGPILLHRNNGATGQELP